MYLHHARGVLAYTQDTRSSRCWVRAWFKYPVVQVPRDCTLSTTRSLFGVYYLESHSSPTLPALPGVCLRVYSREGRRPPTPGMSHRAPSITPANSQHRTYRYVGSSPRRGPRAFGYDCTSTWTTYLAGPVSLGDTVPRRGERERTH